MAHAAEFAIASMLLMPLFFLLPKKLQALLIVLFASAVTIYLLSNYFVYKLYRLHIDMAMLGMFLGEGAKEIFDFPVRMYIQATFAAGLIIVCLGMMWRLAVFFARKGTLRVLKFAYTFLVLCIISFHLIFAWASFFLYSPVVSQVLSLPLVQPLSMNTFLCKRGFERPADLPRFQAQNMKYPLSKLAFEKGKGLNLVVIMVDCLRYDAVSPDVMPNTHTFSLSASRFNRHNASSNHTRHGVFSFFYGLPGKYWDGALAERISPVLMDAIINNGYALGIYGSSTLSSPEFDRTVFANVDGLELRMPGKDSTKRDQAITEKFSRFIETRDKNRPFFSFLFYDSTHSFKYDPNVFSARFLPDDDNNYFESGKRKQQLTFNRYRNSAGFVDVLISQVLRALEQDGLLESTVVIITGDHGEEFDELGLGYSGHNGNFSNYQVHVPMIVHWPSREARAYEHRTSHMDVAPTLMEDVFGCITRPEDYGIGLNLFSPEKRPYIFIMGPSGSYGINIDGTVMVFPLVGTTYAVNEQTYQPAPENLSPVMYRQILQDLSKFKQ